MSLDDISYKLILRLEPFLTNPINKIVNATTDLSHYPTSEKYSGVMPFSREDRRKLMIPSFNIIADIMIAVYTSQALRRQGRDKNGR